MYIYLSNRDAPPQNRSIFKKTLSNPIDLYNGETAKIALVEVCLPLNWLNIENGTTFTLYDTPDRTTSIVVQIPPGYYPDFKKFASVAQKTLQEVDRERVINKLRPSKIIDFKQDSADRPYLLLTSGFGIQLSEKLRLKLGLLYDDFENEIEEDDEPDDIRDARIYLPDLDLHRNHHSCIIACSMVRPVICQDSSQRILRIIPARRQNKAEMIYEKLDPIYHEITSNRIYDIEVAVLAQNYKPLELTAGEAFILLHLTFT